MKILKIVLVIVSFTYASFAKSGFDIALELSRSEGVKAMVNKENSIIDYTQRYIMETGDITPTTAEIQSRYSLPASFWKNTLGSNLTITFNSDSIAISNSNSTLGKSAVLDKIYNSNSLRNYVFAVDTASNPKKITISYSTETRKFLSQVNNLTANSGIIVSAATPDTSKLWFKPDGFGSFEVKDYIGTEWKSLGRYGSDKDMLVIPQGVDVTSVACVTGMGAAVPQENSTLKQYRCDAGSVWRKTVSMLGSSETKSVKIWGVLIDNVTALYNGATAGGGSVKGYGGDFLIADGFNRYGTIWDSGAGVYEPTHSPATIFEDNKFSKFSAHMRTWSDDDVSFFYTTGDDNAIYYKPRWGTVVPTELLRLDYDNKKLYFRRKYISSNIVVEDLSCNANFSNMILNDPYGRCSNATVYTNCYTIKNDTANQYSSYVSRKIYDKTTNKLLYSYTGGVNKGQTILSYCEDTFRLKVEWE